METAAASAVRLWGYYRSSAAYRVRIAIHFKGLSVRTTPVHLRRGEQERLDYLRVNPQGLVPVLEHDGQLIRQSLAIIEYLEERFPEPPLLPSRAADRAFVRSIALSIACDIHPLNNLRVLRFLEMDMGLDSARRDSWYRHWIARGFTALEQLLSADNRVGRHCCGDSISLADVCLVPQWFNAERFDCPLDAYPTLRRLVNAARAHPAFVAAEPERQPDAE
ncbi:MAG: maleylacetoacetate isomerase [Steroidobacteraceae bacterium]|nr:maleylacetoacetate isomerase [Steroidobacteraceae bacterium]MDW8258318.1 maleylacetoacetate isomerase [Gammaproteobacteria bacterium]